MIDTDYKRIEMEKEEMKVILEFPAESEHEEAVKQEIKRILFRVLQEQLEKDAFQQWGNPLQYGKERTI